MLEVQRFGFEVAARAPQVESVNWADLSDKDTLEAMEKLCTAVVRRMTKTQPEFSAEYESGIMKLQDESADNRFLDICFWIDASNEAIIKCYLTSHKFADARSTISCPFTKAGFESGIAKALQTALLSPAVEHWADDAEHTLKIYNAVKASKGVQCIT